MGIGFATAEVVLHLDSLAPRPPRLPDRRIGALLPVAASVMLHAGVVIAATLVSLSVAPVIEPPSTGPIDRHVQHLVFLTPALPAPGGGGGGGNQQPGPIRRATGVGADHITLRVHKPRAAVTSAPVESASPLPSVLLDAKPLASGIFEQAGLPVAVAASGTSTGTGSGGGFGTGTGTGAGSGKGPGLGPGTGGGIGGGIYRAGGAVSAPHLIKQVTPRYTGEALINKIQGTVELEAVVTADGCPSQIRVVRSLDPGGLDEEAIAAAAQWRFEPGRLDGAPVAVVVSIVLSFSLR